MGSFQGELASDDELMKVLSNQMVTQPGVQMPIPRQAIAWAFYNTVPEPLGPEHPNAAALKIRMSTKQSSTPALATSGNVMMALHLRNNIISYILPPKRCHPVCVIVRY